MSLATSGAAASVAAVRASRGRGLGLTALACWLVAVPVAARPFSVPPGQGRDAASPSARVAGWWTSAAPPPRPAPAPDPWLRPPNATPGDRAHAGWAALPEQVAAAHALAPPARPPWVRNATEARLFLHEIANAPPDVARERLEEAIVALTARRGRPLKPPERALVEDEEWYAPTPHHHPARLTEPEREALWLLVRALEAVTRGLPD